MSWTAFSKSLKELRIHFSPNSPTSQGLRDFIVKQYPALKKANPGLPILIREANGVQSSITARFERGREHKSILDNIPVQQIDEKLKQLVNKGVSGEAPKIKN
ncbi:hypothetical protein H4219_001303 [Mycoemilia scoparia]|uniref:Ribosomal protein/NADH dehydrogenase domain-containing protein n=1 Tax=Mycoemilia scoparia TaxID=417184 RepID=A0A9W8A9V5_9FUNG|nr:hypothetical protein H4219_001303 [Mycoemilia scoparia]